ncbi:MAG: diguanylate cyclase (GGDEF)-like protein [Lentisphaeria bacterium]|jgi:diguanylate cyclase (GGDEF)-like protein
MKNILVVEDSALVMKVLKHIIGTCPLFNPSYATSFAEAKVLVESQAEPFFAALVDLNLPDAPDGEVVDYTRSLNIPTVVLTGSYENQKREMLLSKGIVDYVTKEGRYSYEYALSVLVRLVKNQNKKILVVDDSDTGRRLVCNLLKLHLFEVLEANDGIQAIKVLLENPGIKLLITDYNMPRMNGCELIKNIRVKYEKSDLVIIGLSSESDGSLSAHFIKSGANDFLRKPFNQEEFYCRISHNMEFMELIETIRDAANRDELTGAYNRKYFLSRADDVVKEVNMLGSRASIAAIEVESFAEVVDSYGADVADQLVIAVVQKFASLLGRFLFARVSEHRFCVLMQGLDNDKAIAFIERVRQVLGSTSIEAEGQVFAVGFSAGVSSLCENGAEELVSEATTCLKRAIEAGGNLVLGDD